MVGQPQIQDELCRWEVYDHSPNGELIGVVPRSRQGLYKVVNEDADEHAAAVDEVLTLGQLHRRLGHVAMTSILKLIKDSLIEGVKLSDASNVLMFCASHVYSKAMQKPVAKIREGERARVFGERGCRQGGPGDKFGLECRQGRPGGGLNC
jgi:hypothetical protein